jgi:predicted DNA-binding transcriptional regulator YafY
LRQQGDKWYAEAMLPDDETLLSKLLAFGAGIKVVEPLALREKISKEIKKTIALYT